MTTTVIESYESQEISRNYDEAVLELKAHITGSEDTAVVEQDFFSWLTTHPATVGAGLKQTNVKHLGGGIHEATATYVETSAEIVKTVRYRTTGQTARIIQGYGTVYSAALTGSPPNFNGLVGVTRDGVEGVDVPIPSFSFSIDYRFSAVSQAYLYLCHQLTGCVNNAPYLGFAIGELLFNGIEGEVGMTAGGAIVLSSSPISLNFEASPNLSGLQVGPFTIPFKFGWDYLWPRTVEETSNDAVIRKTTSVHIDRVLRWADLSALGV
ncbi:MAG: hypothetical protein SGI77_12675 [Pirellulaceae bacterium]|nr:hypothetical protein [Pirellulaceae bacterium]